MKHFVGDKPFAGGDSPNLADYKVAPFLFSAAQPLLKAKFGFALNAPAAEFVKRFCDKVGASGIMESCGGYSIKEWAASKE